MPRYSEGCLTLVITRSDADERTGALATFFAAGHSGISLPVVGVGLALEQISARVTLLIFGAAVAAGIVAAAPILTRPTSSEGLVAHIAETTFDEWLATQRRAMATATAR